MLDAHRGYSIGPKHILLAIEEKALNEASEQSRHSNDPGGKLYAMSYHSKRIRKLKQDIKFMNGCV